MITTKQPLFNRGTVHLICRNPQCAAEMVAETTEGRLKHEPAEGIYPGYDYYSFTCPHCGEQIRANKDSVKWTREPSK